MKRINYTVLTLSILFSIISCGVNPTNKMAELIDKVYIGMPISEFKEKVESEEVVEMNSQVTIYRVVIKNYNDLYGWRSDYRYFYFLDNKLDKMDKGEKAVDYRVKID